MALSTWFILRTHGIESAVGMGAFVGALLVSINPLWNLGEDLGVIVHDDSVFLLINLFTWVGIALSMAATAVHSGLWARWQRWWQPELEAPVCSR